MTAFPSATFTTAISGALNRFTITQTGPDTADARQQVWAVGADPNEPPGTDTTNPLTGIKASADGSVIQALGPVVWWFHPTIAITLSAINTNPMTYQVRVDVEGAGPEDSDTTQPIGVDDYDAMIAFVKAAAFPPIS